MSLGASVFAAWETRAVIAPPLSIPIGKTAAQSFRVICRCQGDEGRRLPETLEARGPIQARFSGPATEIESPDGFTEATREVELTHEASVEAGYRHGSVLFRWSDGGEERYDAEWDVPPAVRATPQGLVLKSAAGLTWQTIRLTSDSRPFQVIGVTGAWLGDGIEIPQGAAVHHSLRLAIDSSRAPGGSGTSEIVVTTDHPDQRSVKISILALPGGVEGGK